MFDLRNWIDRKLRSRFCDIDKFPFSEPSYPVLIDLAETGHGRDQWCEENLRYRYTIKCAYTSKDRHGQCYFRLEYIFIDPIDAFHFKMRWC